MTGIYGTDDKQVAITNNDMFDVLRTQDIISSAMSNLPKWYAVGGTDMYINSISAKPHYLKRVASGTDNHITITYTNGRQWHQKKVDWWEVVESKGGGYDLKYKFREGYVLTDQKSYEADYDSVVTYTTKKGDIGYITTHNKNVYGIKEERVFQFQKIDGEK